MSTERHDFGCPFCGNRVAARLIVVTLPAMRAFELHLDTHMARGDQLLPSLRVAS